jgi:hypothetical protein
MISNEAKKLTDRLYKSYGSGSGYLFGILPNYRSAVEAIVQVTMEMVQDPETMEEVKGE